MTRSDQYLRAAQAQFDRLHFDRDYVELPFAAAKVRHIGEHIGKATFKLFTYQFEHMTHSTQLATRNRVVKEVVPDLAIYRTQLANTLHIDLTRAIKANEPSPPQTIDGAILQLALAGSVLNVYTEPFAHGLAPKRDEQAGRTRIRQLAIPLLHGCAVGLAEQFGIEDLRSAHAERLTYLYDHPVLGR